VLRFDPATGAFTPLSGLLVPRTLMTGVALADDRLLMFGGITADGAYSATGELYRPGRPATQTTSLGVGRAWHTVSRLPGGRVLIVGGQAPDGTPVPNAVIYE